MSTKNKSRQGQQENTQNCYKSNCHTFSIKCDKYIENSTLLCYNIAIRNENIIKNHANQIRKRYIDMKKRKKINVKNIAIFAVLAVIVGALLFAAGYMGIKIFFGDDTPTDSSPDSDNITDNEIPAEDSTESEYDDNDDEILESIPASETPIDDLEYTLANSQVTITKYIGKGKDINIRSEINGLPVTGIGEGAFSGNDSLITITIPDSVTFIANRAFEYCTNLREITIPNSVISIGNMAFWYCSSLREITIPDSVISIGYDAFIGCTNLAAINVDRENIAYIGEGGVLFDKSKTTLIRYPAAKPNDSYTVPQNIGEIKDRAFDGCVNLKSINADSENMAYSSDDGVLFNKSKSKLIRYPNAKSGDSYVMPRSVTSVGNYSFEDCENLIGITLSERLASIGNSAFENCPKLEEIKLPARINSVGNGAFRHCVGLTEITLPNNLVSINDRSFADCKNLSTVYFSHSDAADIKQFGREVFANTAENFKIVYLKDAAGFSEPEWRGYTAQADAVSPLINFEYISDDDGNVTITKYKGEEINVVIPSPIEEMPVTEIGEKAFEGCSAIESIALPDTVISIGSGAFRNCSELKSITIPDNLVSIGDWAFWYCRGLTALTIPASTTNIGWEALVGCISLTAINVDSDNEIYNSESGILFNKENTVLISYPSSRRATSYTVPNTVTEIKGRAFFDNKNLRTITIPGSVATLGFNVFEFCENLTAINVDADNATYSSDDGILFNKSGTALIRYPRAKTETSYTVPYSVKDIRNDAFANCSNLTLITIPANVTSAGEGAFRNCNKLQAVHFEGNVPNIIDSDGIIYEKFRAVAESVSIHYNYDVRSIFYKAYEGLDGREYLEQFLNDIKNRNYINVALALGNFLGNNITAYKFIEDMTVDSWRIISEQDDEFQVELNISKSGNEYFSVGKSIWQADVWEGYDGTIHMFRPIDAGIETMDGQPQDDIRQFCTNFTAYVGFYTTSDFNFLRDVEHHHGLADALLGLVTDDGNALNEYGDWKGTKIDYLNKLANGIFGVNIDFGDGFKYDFAESDFRLDYDAKTNSVWCAHGASWLYAAVASDIIDARTNKRTIVIDYYADIAYLVVAKTIRYNITLNNDGSFRFDSTELVYDSGYYPAAGSV